MKLATGCGEKVLVPENAGAALVAAGMGTRPMLKAWEVPVVSGEAPFCWPLNVAAAGALVMKVTCGTVTWLVTTTTVVPVEIVCVKLMVVTGGGAAVVACCGLWVIIIVVPGAVEVTTA